VHSGSGSNKAATAVHRRENANATATLYAVRHQPVPIGHAAIGQRTTVAHVATNATKALRAAVLRRAVSLSPSFAGSSVSAGSTTAPGTPESQAPEHQPQGQSR
jgi:hypothetical protein